MVKGKKVPTRVLVYSDNKQSRIEIDIDTANRVTAIRRVGARPATVTLGRKDGSRSYTLARTATSLTIGTGTAARIQLTFDGSRGRYDGMVGEVRDE